MLLSTNESWLKLLIAEILHHLIPHFYSVLSKKSHLGLQDLGHQQEVSFPIFQLPRTSLSWQHSSNSGRTQVVVHRKRGFFHRRHTKPSLKAPMATWKRSRERDKTLDLTWLVWVGWFMFPSVSSLATSQVVSSIEAHSLDAQRLDKVVLNFKAYPSGEQKTLISWKSTFALDCFTLQTRCFVRPLRSLSCKNFLLAQWILSSQNWAGATLSKLKATFCWDCVALLG